MGLDAVWHDCGVDEDQATQLLLRIPAEIAEEIVDADLAEYHYADTRGLGADLLEIGVNAAGGVTAVVLIAMTKAAAAAVSRAIQRRRPDAQRNQVEVRIVGPSLTGNGQDGQIVVIVLDDAGTGLFQLTRRPTQEAEESGRPPS